MNGTKSFLLALSALFLMSAPLVGSRISVVQSFLHGEATIRIADEEPDKDPAASAMVTLTGLGRFQIVLDGEVYRGKFRADGPRREGQPRGFTLWFDEASRDELKNRIASRTGMLLGPGFVTRKFSVHGSATLPEGGWWIESAAINATLVVEARNETVHLTYLLDLTK